MVTEVLKTKAVQRLMGILSNRYGTGLRVNFMMDISSVDMTAQSPSMIEGDMRIPIISDGEFLAYAFVENATGLSDLDQSAIADLVMMTLEPAIKEWKQRSDYFTATTLHLRSAALTESADASNVVAFPKLKLAEQEFVETSHVALSTNVIFMLSRNPNLISKVAHELHELTQRWGFVRFADIRTQVQSAEDLKSLGAMTILVDDILLLNEQEKTLIENYLALHATDLDPMILIASTSDIESLKQEEIVTESFAKKLSASILAVDKLPTKTSVLQETLELFLEPLQMI